MAERGADGKFVKKTERIVDSAHNEQFAAQRVIAGDAQQAVDRGFAQAEQFPTSKLTDKENVDRVNLLKLELQDDRTGHPGITKFGRLEAKDSDFEWLLRKKDAAKAIAFQQWFAENFDRMTPPAKEFAREIYPKFYADREATLEENLETAKKIAKLKLFGPRSQEDLALQFALDQGFIDVEQIMRLINPGSVSDLRRVEKAKLGLLNPNRYLFKDTGLAVDSDYRATHDPEASLPADHNKLSFWNWQTNGAGAQMNNRTVLASIGLPFN